MLAIARIVLLHDFQLVVEAPNSDSIHQQEKRVKGPVLGDERVFCLPSVMPVPVVRRFG